MNKKTCDECNGTRLRRDASYFKIADKHIGELAEMDLKTLQKWFVDLDDRLSNKQKTIGAEILKEINKKNKKKSL